MLCRLPVRTARVLFAAAAATVLAFSPALAAPPSDEQITEAIRQFEEARANVTTREELQEAAAKALEGLKLEDLTAVQIGRLLSLNLISPMATAEEAWDRLETFLNDRGAAGAVAAVHTLNRRLAGVEDLEAKLAIYRDATAHPGLEAAITSGGVNIPFSRFRVGPDLAKAAAAEVQSLARLLKPELAEKVAPNLAAYYDLARMALAEDKSALENLRQKIVQFGRDAVAGLSERDAGRVNDALIYLDGAFARGTLMNGAAPEVEVLWSSDAKITSLAALRGRVVVVDFWATWCGPCVASFPKIRELVSHYQGYPVTVIGITSLQGKHYPGEGRPPVDTKDDPEKEFTLMAEYIGERDITWPIVFTKQSCFNGEYGVRGIPHVAIIDPAGNVRHNELRPGSPLAKKAELIDALLKEFNLPSPEPVVEEEKAAKNEAGS